MANVTHAAPEPMIPVARSSPPPRAAKRAAAKLGNQAMLRLQRKATVSTPGDAYEREADAIADRVMRVPASGPPAIQRACATCDDDRPIQRAAAAAGAPDGTALQAAVRTAARGGAELPGDVRTYFESRIGHDFRAVRVHHDGEAAASARAVNARAYTVGRDVVFGAGEYQPGTAAGKHLLAHELAHVVQQRDAAPRVMRQTPTPLDRLLQGLAQLPPPDVATFCRPYDTVEQARQVHAIATSSFLPVLQERYGADVAAIWRTYLGRRHGESLARRLYSEGHAVARAFAASQNIADRQAQLADAAAQWYQRTCPALVGAFPHGVPAETIFSPADLAFPINFNVPMEIPGNIAGGVGSSDAGPDTRRVTGEVIFARSLDPAGHTTAVIMRLALRFIVDDAVDFCPGDPGTGVEQMLTVPLSRLEASGATWPQEVLAYDVPFQVRFDGPTLDRNLSPEALRACDPAAQPPAPPTPAPPTPAPPPPADPDRRL